MGGVFQGGLRSKSGRARRRATNLGRGSTAGSVSPTLGTKADRARIRGAPPAGPLFRYRGRLTHAGCFQGGPDQSRTGSEPRRAFRTLWRAKPTGPGSGVQLQQEPVPVPLAFRPRWAFPGRARSRAAKLEPRFATVGGVSPTLDAKADPDRVQSTARRGAKGGNALSRAGRFDGTQPTTVVADYASVPRLRAPGMSKGIDSPGGAVAQHSPRKPLDGRTSLCYT
jgi:hypothetical protein